MNYKLIKEKSLDELNSHGYLYKHKSGAEIVHIKNNDENKVFSITFQTPAENDCGTAHILEHMVLCGSEKYPVKDPFYELCKGSLYTFLNAMTFKDKTMYPIASCNETDFYNLMDVYLDAVFNTLIKGRKEVFLQEGWNYKVSENKEIVGYNGIVYNEMRGVYSDPLEILEYYNYKNLFGQSPYSYDSGGKPDEISNLTYEKLLEFYDKNYRPENCYIYIYGDLDIDKCLDYMDKNYLSKFEWVEDFAKPCISLKPLDKTVYFKGNYPCNEEKLNNKKYLSCAYVFDNDIDNKMILALRVLKNYLMERPSSPVKRMLIESKMAEDTICNFDTTIKTPVFTIIAKNSEKTMEEFEKSLEDILKKITIEGVDAKLMKACLNKLEFIIKEENFGRRPRGLAINFQIISDWVYKNEPFEKTFKLKYLEELKGDMGYFSDLIKICFIDNKWKAYVCLESEKQIENEKFLLKDAVNILNIIKDNKKMSDFQNSKDTKKDLEKIPLLDLSKVNCDVEKIPVIEKEIAGKKILHSPLETNDIGYVDIIFEIKEIEQGKIPYIGLLCYLLKKMDTNNFALNELTSEINEYLGGFNFHFKTFDKNNGEYKSSIILRSKAISSNISKIFEMAHEVCKNTIFNDEKKLKELIKELNIKLEDSLLNEGQNYAISRVLSQMFESGDYTQNIAGFEFHIFIRNLSNKLETENDNVIKILVEELENASKVIFNKTNIMFGVTCTEKNYPNIERGIEYFINNIGELKHLPKGYDFTGTMKKEGIATNSNVQYVVKGWKLNENLKAKVGKIAVLLNILDGAYLLQKVRLEGGAYGCYSRHDRRGAIIFYSYRDPNLADTVEVYKNFIEFLEGFEIDQRELDKYILGAINKYLRPKHVSEKGYFAINATICEIRHDEMAREREDILSFSMEDLKEIVVELKKSFNQDYLCVVGNRVVLEGEKDIFDEVLE